jgi:hypothetical protein
MTRQKGKLGFAWHQWFRGGYISFGHTAEIYFGESGDWGLELTYDHLNRSVHLMLIHWYIGVQFWVSED